MDQNFLVRTVVCFYAIAIWGNFGIMRYINKPGDGKDQTMTGLLSFI